MKDQFIKTVTILVLKREVQFTNTNDHIMIIVTSQESLRVLNKTAPRLSLIGLL